MDAIEMLVTDSFIVLMLFILWAWDLPERCLSNRLVMKLRWPIERLGLFHSWRLFSPDPSIDNYRLQFRIRLADGSVVTIEPEYLRYPGRQRQPVRYRWSKIKNSLLRAENLPLRASVCKYVAAEYLAQSAAEARAPYKSPVQVQLVRWRQPIAPWTAPASASDEPYRQKIIHTQLLTPGPVAAAATGDVEPLRPALCIEGHSGE